MSILLLQNGAALLLQNGGHILLTGDLPPLPDPNPYTTGHLIDGRHTFTLSATSSIQRDSRTPHDLDATTGHNLDARRTYRKKP